MTKSTPILGLADAFADAAIPASFQTAVLRFRNTRWARRVDLAELDEAAWAAHFVHFNPCLL